ncbi:MAG TPA: LytTR family DNA-binding domain-containing protein [Acidobacteriota bacterium]|nr:LytTR family DNA-binding domain-containing protein [Acidobacteriota bacterium]HNB73189.1 LytTR family DNA-binding domain-containing protein [Acidobacteriota bacterium]HND21502.1 LytTR family DNA-binding domain-containing protein [Acidobacteriota bacterium]HNG93289.1 LytTR family DNA-binding domain-containing protein [Acidobacteriota bacterium]
MTLTTPISVLIVDDDCLARDCMRSVVEASSGFSVIGECTTGLGVIKAMEDLSPSLILLDIQMPMMNGLELVESLGELLPLVVFVTAFDRYAVTAFDHHAVDYVLKPIDRLRLEKSLQRAKVILETRQKHAFNQKLIACLHDLKLKYAASSEQILIRSAGNSLFLKVQSIDWVEAEGSYVRLHIGKNSHLIRENIGSFLSRMDPKIFIRIHRSVAVNVDRVVRLQSLLHGDMRVVLRDETELILSRSYRQNLRDIGV